MIEPGYVHVMARYNAWQNNQLAPVVEAMPPVELTRNRGAFFGSIFATLNHLLWADELWMNRFDPERLDPPAVPAAQHRDRTATIAEWAAERRALDGKIIAWAGGLSPEDLQGDLKWHAAMMNTDMARPRAMCIATVFNHQTHHRGQVHAMLTAAGVAAPVSDLILMPEDV